MGCKSAIARTPGTRFYLYQVSPSRYDDKLIVRFSAEQEDVELCYTLFKFSESSCVVLTISFDDHRHRLFSFRFIRLPPHHRPPQATRAQKSEPIDHQKAVLCIENRIDRWVGGLYSHEESPRYRKGENRYQASGRLP